MKVTFIILFVVSIILLYGVNFFKFERLIWLCEKFLDLTIQPSENLATSDQCVVQEAKLEMTKLIQFYGYTAENHSVLTKDGFILKLHRIPTGKNKPNDTNNQKQFPILLQHGILCGSGQWIFNREESLGFILANSGFDVWMGNFRGNCYSKHHLKLSRSDHEYWNFGFDKHAKYDIPAMVDYIRFKTGYDQILTIGHSMGFTALATALASQSSLNNKIKGLIGLGPVLHIRYAHSHLKKLCTILALAKLVKSKIFFDHSKLSEDVMLRLCPASSSNVCSDLIHIINGFNPEIHNNSRIPIFVNHCMCGNSIHIMHHWCQLIDNAKLEGYDYGEEKNLLEYGEPTPIQYNISNIKVPVALLYANNDGFSNTIDNSLTLRKMSSLVSTINAPGIFSSHLDYFVSEKQFTFKTTLSWIYRILNYS